MEHSYLLAGPILLAAYAWYAQRPKTAKGRLPVIVDIPAEDIFTRPREAYEEALATHGPIIGVRRRGRLEYVVNQEYARYVLTCDRLFSFELGSAAVMNLQPIMALTNGALFRDLHDLVRDGIVARIDEIVYRIWPIFQRDAKDFVELASEGIRSGRHPSCFDHFKGTIAQTALILLFGQDYLNERNLEIVEDVSKNMAELTGQYQNFSLIGKYLPVLWVVYTWVKVMLVNIPLGFLRVFGPLLWKDIDRYQKMATSGNVAPQDEPRSILYLVVKTNAPPDGSRIGIFRRIYIIVLLLCLIFAAVHTT